MAVLRALKHAWRMINPWAPMIRDGRGRPVPMYRLDHAGIQTDRDLPMPRPVFDRMRKALLARTTSGMGAPPVVQLIFAGAIYLYVAVSVPIAPWNFLAPMLAMAGFLTLSAFTYRYRIPKVARETTVATMLGERLCPSCAYSLAAIDPNPDGRTTCPECGAVWDIPSASPPDIAPVSRPPPTTGAVPCINCRYDLRGLITLRGATCPECGTEHSLRQLTQIDPLFPAIQMLWYLGLAPTVAIATFVLGRALGRSGGLATGTSLEGISIAAGSLVMFGVFYRIFFPPLRRHGKGFALAFAALPAAAITGAVAFVAYLVVRP